MRRAKYETIDIDRQLWEPDYRTWLKSPTVPIGELLAALDRRTFVVRHNKFELSNVRLLDTHIAALKRCIARRIQAEGGEWRSSALVLRSVPDSLEFTVHLPGG
jgi:hypothetical protein